MRILLALPYCDMNDWIEKVDNLDVSVFEAVPSQTNAEDRRSLLAVQRATAKRSAEYTYLEIGSHLGGTIQPHFVDDRCEKIYSIDARPSQQPDDRSPGYIAYYEHNSTERMLKLLQGIDGGGIAKIDCFDADASKVGPDKITSRPQIVLIDGEHTKSAVLSDFQFCRRVVSESGTILFHDFDIIYPAIREICDQLNEEGCTYLPLKLGGSVFAIFFDPRLAYSDPYLQSLAKERDSGTWSAIDSRITDERMVIKNDRSPDFLTKQKTYRALPKLIYLYWDQGWDRAPELVRRCARSWGQLNPEYVVRRLSRRDLYEQLPEFYLRLGRLKSLLLRRTISLQALSRLLRVRLLTRHGGVWANAATLCRRPLRDWLPDQMSHGFFAFRNEDDEHVFPDWFLATTPRHPLTSRIHDRCLRYWRFRREAGDSWFHDIVAGEFKNDYKMRDLITRIPYFDAIRLQSVGPHRLYPFDETNALAPVTKKIQEELDRDRCPLYKLSWKVQPKSGSVLEYVLQKPAASNPTTSLGPIGRQETTEGHLGGYIIGQAAPGTWCPGVWDRLMREEGVRSMLDVGCGLGYVLRYFHDNGCDVLGVDGSPSAVTNNVMKSHVRKHDFSTGAWSPEKSYDLVWSSEFLEHVEEKYIGNFMPAFSKAKKYVVVTYATPGQGGHHHVNENTEAYWCDRFKDIGFVIDDSLTKIARSLVPAEGKEGSHFRNKGVVFRRNTTDRAA